MLCYSVSPVAIEMQKNQNQKQTKIPKPEHEQLFQTYQNRKKSYFWKFLPSLYEDMEEKGVFIYCQ